FNLDEDEEVDDVDDQPVVPLKKKKLGKNPDVDTSFLPDRDREVREYVNKKLVTAGGTRAGIKINACKLHKVRVILIICEYELNFQWKCVFGKKKLTLSMFPLQMKKGNTISQFLQKCVEQLRKDFTEFRAMTTENLMYIKEDLIIPHHYSFYDFIQSHAGKVVLRSWYERNKHIFPASRWEPYDPEKKWDKYTISDKSKAS
ncbi:protein FAM50A-like, partial [Stylophora pistillata]|uniref:protein FAM50A-like n=1 Tax=Stylophora pistillata TaxID=50429 RepID=UPI000C0495BC